MDPWCWRVFKPFWVLESEVQGLGVRALGVIGLGGGKLRVEGAPDGRRAPAAKLHPQQQTPFHYGLRLLGLRAGGSG